MTISANNSVTTSVTFLSVDTGRLIVDGVMTVTGSLLRVNITISKSAERGILMVDTQGGSALFTITDEGGLPQEVQANPEVRVVFDITG